MLIHKKILQNLENMADSSKERGREYESESACLSLCLCLRETEWKQEADLSP